MMQSGGGEDDVRLGIVKFLGMFAQLVGPDCQPYGSNLMRLARKAVRADKSNRVKAAAFDLLQLLLQMKLELRGQDHFVEPQDLIKTLFQELQLAKSKLAQSVRGQILATLGLLSELHPAQFSPTQSQKLAILYMETLNSEMKAGPASQSLQRQLVKGVFQGLKHFLHNFAEYFQPDAQKKVMRLSFLFQNMMLGLSVEHEVR
eukprot:gb/GEZN01022008.1/.p1 GENE.gb/GEZN01022008.1/~~gb/GEZN01022008.1/.p1  ORF type:complete len:212 (+),score=36.94 gb/GEZN01022008.1/:28-636(+)